VPAERGTRAVCIREAQRTLAQSSKRLIESKIASLGVGSGFRLFSDKIETPGDGIIIFRGMQLRADFQHLRRWRKSVEQAQSFQSGNHRNRHGLCRRGMARYQGDTRQVIGSWRAIRRRAVAVLTSLHTLLARSIASRPDPVTRPFLRRKTVCGETRLRVMSPPR
jgi:hypothetical protein